MSYTDNPVRDAEEHYSREDPRPIVGACEYCGNPIYGPTEDMYGDDYVELRTDWCIGSAGAIMDEV